MAGADIGLSLLACKDLEFTSISGMIVLEDSFNKPFNKVFLFYLSLLCA